MNWTSVVPSKTGWYWCKYHTNLEVLHVEYLPHNDSIQVTFGPNQTRLFCNSKDPATILRNNLYSWYGPLQPPSELEEPVKATSESKSQALPNTLVISDSLKELYRAMALLKDEDSNFGKLFIQHANVLLKTLLKE